MLKQIGLALFLMWIFTVLTVFYVIQKPFTMTNVFALSDMGLNILVVGWFTLVAMGWGVRIFAGLRIKTLTLEEQLIFGSGLGLGGLGLLSLAMGMVGGWSPWGVGVVAILLTVAILPDWLRLAKRFQRAMLPSPPPWIGSYLLMMGLLTGLMALLPPVDWDGLFYHLTAPKQYIAHHQIISGIDVPHYNFPFLAEMQFTFLMVLKGDISAKLIHLIYAGLTISLIYQLTRRFVASSAAWLAVVVLMTIPMLLTLATWAYNDIGLTFYQIAALYALLAYRYAPPEESHPQRWLIISGLCVGFAMGFKYTSFVGPLTLGLLLLYWLLKEWSTHPLRLKIQTLFAFVGPAFLMAVPWYLKNYFFTGNPFYPFLFGGLYWDEFRAAWYAQAGTGVGFDVGMVLGLPLFATFGVYDANYFDGRIGPIIVLFLPLILLYGLCRYRTKERPPTLDILMLFALSQYLFWTVGVMWSKSLWQSRLLLTCVVALAPVIAWIWGDLAHLNSRHFSIQRFINLLMGVVLLLTLTERTLQVIQTNPLTYLAGYETREQNLTRRMGGHYIAMQQLNADLPLEAVVLFLWEPRSYYCERDCRPDSILDRLAHDEHKHGSAAAIAAAWRQEGITHVLVFRQGLDFIIEKQTEALSWPAIAALEGLEEEHLHRLFTVGGYDMYRLEDKP